MPFEQALAAAGGGGVLGDEYRVAAHRRLPAVVGGIGRCETLQKKPHGVFAHCGETFSADELNVGSL